MTKWKKLSYTIYQCKYHIVWCPKYRYRILKGALAEFVEQTLKLSCSQEEALLGKPPLKPGILFKHEIDLDEPKIRKYINYQEERERKEEGDQQDFGLF